MYEYYAEGGSMVMHNQEEQLIDLKYINFITWGKPVSNSKKMNSIIKCNVRMKIPSESPFNLWVCYGVFWTLEL